jgi:hypothetical protein
MAQWPNFDICRRVIYRLRGPKFLRRDYFAHASGVEAAYMRKRNRRPPCRKIVLKLPDLDQAKSAVLNSLSSPHSRRNYKFAMEQFISWYCSEPRLALNRTVVLRFRLYLESLGLAAGTVNQRLAASGDSRMKLPIPACSARNSLREFAGSKA